MRLGATLGEGLAFPFDFGFFPSTRGEDGDPLDVLLFLDEGVPPGCVATARLIGVLEVEQKEKRKPWKRNDRFFAVATHAHSHRGCSDSTDLPPHRVAGGRSLLRPLRRPERQEAARRCATAGRQRARKLLRAGVRVFKGKQ